MTPLATRRGSLPRLDGQVVDHRNMVGKTAAPLNSDEGDQVPAPKFARSDGLSTTSIECGE
jgi:hypothetical protein